MYLYNQLKVLIIMNKVSNNSYIKDTEILMYNGEIKKIQDIKINDYVMGINNKPLEVKNIDKNINKLYKISHNMHDETYIINKDYKLLLKYIFPKCIYRKKNIYFISRFDKKSLKEINITFKFNNQNKDTIKEKAYNFYNNIIDNTVIEISIVEYLNLSVDLQNKLQGLKQIVLFNDTDCIFDPYVIGFSESINIYGMVSGFIISTLYKNNSLDIRRSYIAGVIDSIGYLYTDDKYYIDVSEYNTYVKDLIFIIKSINLNCIYKNNVLKIYGKEIFNLPIKKLKMVNKLERYNNKISINEYGNDICYNLQFTHNSQFLLGNCIVVNGFA